MDRHCESSLPLRMLIGASLGTAAGALLVGIGVIRAAIVVLGGGRLGPVEAEELRGIVYYVGGFAVGGALFGALKPVLRGNSGVYVGCMLVGVVVMLAISLADKGNLRELDAFEWVVLPPLGAVLGAAAAYGWTRKPA